MDTLNCMKALISLLGVILAMAFMASPAHAQSHENDRYQKLADDLKTPGLAVVTFDANGVTDEHYVGVDSNSNPIGRIPCSYGDPFLNRSRPHWR